MSRIYKQFLAAPNSSLLADDASLHYVTTLTSFNGSTAIMTHLNGQSKHLRKKEEKVMDAIEGNGALFVEVETTLEFLLGGGAFLPRIDDNFLADRVVTLPIVHIVTFDGNDKISLVRQSWDQGSLLKQIEVIGRTGMNWPIRLGTDQIKLIQSSIASASKKTNGAAASSSASVGASEVDTPQRSRHHSTHATRDPHASLHLTHNADEEEHPPAVLRARAGSRQPERNFQDLFPEQAPDIDESHKRTTSPFKHAVSGSVPPKGGAGKKYQPSRIFHDEDYSDSAPERPHSKDSDVASHDDGKAAKTLAARPSGNGSKHAPTWSFDDFSTPVKAVPGKAVPSKNAQDRNAKHWGTENDDANSPVYQPKGNHPRKDALRHFEMADNSPAPKPSQTIIGAQDEPLPQPRLMKIAGDGMGGRRVPLSENAPHPKSSNIGDGMGNHKTPISDDASQPKNSSIGDGMGNRKLPFSEDAPHPKNNPKSDGTGNSTVPISDDLSQPKNNHIGDGMGNRKVPFSEDAPHPKNNPRSDGTGNSKVPISDDFSQPKNNTIDDGMGNRKIPLATGLIGEDDAGKHRGINVSGDGMGGRKGAGRSWRFGDESD